MINHNFLNQEKNNYLEIYLKTHRFLRNPLNQTTLVSCQIVDQFIQVLNQENFKFKTFYNQQEDFFNKFKTKNNK